MKMYVLVRRDLNQSYQAVQGGHALAEFLLNCPQDWGNSTLIYLGVNDEFHLKRWEDKLERLGITYAEWREPDIGDQITAIAAYSSEKVFNNLNLL